MGKSNLKVIEEEVEVHVMTATEKLLADKAEVLAEIASRGNVAGSGEDQLVWSYKRYLQACVARVMNDSDAPAVWEAYATARNKATVTGKVLATKGKECKSQVSEIRALSHKAIVAVGPTFVDYVISAKLGADRAAKKAVTHNPNKSVYEACRKFRDFADMKGAETPDDIRALFTEEVGPTLMTRWISKAVADKQSLYEELLAKLEDFRKLLEGTEEKDSKFAGMSCREDMRDLAASVSRFSDTVASEWKEVQTERQVRDYEEAQQG